MPEVRPFARSDREQLARLVNAHIATVSPGSYLPVATMLNDLERPLGEHIIGPWVSELVTLVAVERDQLVAAAHLRRFADDDRASESLRNTGEIWWLLFWPEHMDAGRALRNAALEQLEQWAVRAQHADGTLPAPGVYGVSDSWPHVSQLYSEGGFDASSGQVELVFFGGIGGFPSQIGRPELAGLELRRQVGPTMATSFDAILDGEVVGSYEVDTDLTRGGSMLAFAGWADECNHWVREDLRGRGIGTWLVSEAADWMRLGGITRVMSYAIESTAHAHNAARAAVVEDWRSYYARYGLRQISRNVRGWTRVSKS